MAAGDLAPQKHIGLELFYTLASIILVSVRFYILRHQLTWEQPWQRKLGHMSVLVAGILMVGMVAPNLWILTERERGEGKPGTLENDLTPPQTVAMLKFLMWNKLDYIVELYVVKLGFLAIYLDLHRNLETGVRIMLHCTSVYTILAFCASFFPSLLFCEPFWTNWSLTHDCSSFHSLPIVTVQYVTNVTTDILLLILSHFVLSGLQLSRRERVAVAFIIGVGLITIVAGTIRFVLLYNFIMAAASSVPSTSNTVFLASEAEMFAGLVAICLPAFRVLLRRQRSGSQKTHSSMRRTMFTDASGKGKKKKGKYGETLMSRSDDVSSVTELRTIDAGKFGVESSVHSSR